MTIVRLGSLTYLDYRAAYGVSFGIVIYPPAFELFRSSVGSTRLTLVSPTHLNWVLSEAVSIDARTNSLGSIDLFHRHGLRYECPLGPSKYGLGDILRLLSPGDVLRGRGPVLCIGPLSMQH